MSRLQDIAGQRFGSLCALFHLGGPHWFCRCDCGKYTATPRGWGLRNGIVRSCGRRACKRRENHEWDKIPEYNVWLGMRKRCCKSNHQAFADYGGRGIKICERWQTSFSAFLADMGPRPTPKHQLNRIDNDGNYEPSNCNWVLQSENMRNTRYSRLLTFQEITLTLVEWTERTGIPENTIRERIRRGWSVEKSLTTPARTKRSPGSTERTRFGRRKSNT